MPDGGSAHFSDPGSARAFLEACRWPGGVLCPRCGAAKSYALQPAPGSTTRAGLFKCAACRRQFSVVTGTICERTHLPLQVWLRAIDCVCAAPAGMTPQELRTALAISYKTASALAMRLRRVVERWPGSGKGRPQPRLTNRDRTVVRLHPLPFPEAVRQVLQVGFGGGEDRLRRLDEQFRP